VHQLSAFQLEQVIHEMQGRDRHDRARSPHEADGEDRHINGMIVSQEEGTQRPTAHSHEKNQHAVSGFAFQSMSLNDIDQTESGYERKQGA
jgi:hypothetical protein